MCRLWKSVPPCGILNVIVLTLPATRGSPTWSWLSQTRVLLAYNLAAALQAHTQMGIMLFQKWVCNCSLNACLQFTKEVDRLMALWCESVIFIKQFSLIHSLEWFHWEIHSATSGSGIWVMEDISHMQSWNTFYATTAWCLGSQKRGCIWLFTKKKGKTLPSIKHLSMYGRASP